MPDRAPTALQNWAGNIRFSPSRFEAPATLDEARAAVAAAPRLRVLGSGHSFNAIAASDATMISLAGIEPEVQINALTGTVRASGWITYAALSDAVHRSGFALHNMASLPHISVAGSIATGTHGSGNGNGNLATAVASIEFIGADGELRTVARGDEDFAGSVVHLGALGVVHAVTLDLLPGFAMRQYVYEGLGLDKAVAHFDELTSAAYSTSLFTAWGAAPTFEFWVKQRTSDQSHPFPQANWYGAPLADGPRHPDPGRGPGRVHAAAGADGPLARAPAALQARVHAELGRRAAVGVPGGPGGRSRGTAGAGGDRRPARAGDADLRGPHDGGGRSVALAGIMGATP